jgi:TP901 family phage tail tape measure protein
MSDVRSVTVRMSVDTSQGVANMRSFGSETEQVAGRITRAGARTSNGWDMVNKTMKRTAVVGVAGLAMIEKANLSFDKQMSAAAAATTTQTKTLGKLREAAIQMGADTVFSATEAAQGITELGKAGVSTKDILSGGLAGALNLAAAGELGVGEAAEYTATTLNQFGLKGTQASHVADLLAAGAGKAQGEVRDMALALSYAGVPAAQLGVSIEELSGVIGLLASKGVIGDKAGTSLRGMLSSLTAPSKQASKTMAELGINVFDAKGNFVGLDGVASQLHGSLSNLTQKERSYALGRIFGNQQLQAANILYEAGAKGVHDWTNKVNDAGFAAKNAEDKMDNLSGDIEKVKGSLETAFIKGGGGAQKGLRDLAKTADKAIDAFTELPDAVQSGVVKTVAAVTGLSLAGLAIGSLKKGIDGLRGIKGGPTGKFGAAAGVTPVFVTNPGFGGNGGGTVVAGGDGGKSGKGGGKFSKGVGIAGLGALGLSLTPIPKKLGISNTVTGLGLGALTGNPWGAALGGGIGLVNDFTAAYDNLGEAAKRAEKAVGGTAPKQAAALKSINKEFEKMNNPDDAWGWFAKVQRDLPGPTGYMLGIAPKFLGDKKYKNAVKAQRDLVAAMKEREEVAKRLEAKDSWDGMFGPKKDAVIDYRNLLDSLPLDVVTKIGAPGVKPTTAMVQDLVEKYKLTPEQKQTLVKLLGGPAAISEADRVQNKINQMRGKEINIVTRFTQIGVRAGINAGVGKADGGAVFGPGGPRDDMIPARLSAGEHVLTAAEVQAAGGQAAIYRLRAGIRSGLIRGFADGGAVEDWLEGGINDLEYYANGGGVKRRSGRRSTRSKSAVTALKRLSAAADRAHDSLDAETKKRDEAKDSLNNLKESVTSTLTSDLFGDKSAGWAWMSAADRNSKMTGDVFSKLQFDINQSSQWASLSKSLSSRGVSGQALQALFEQAGVEGLQAMASLDNASLARYQSLFDQRTASIASTSGASANQVWGGQVATLNAKVASLTQAAKQADKRVAAAKKAGKKKSKSVAGQLAGGAKAAKARAKHKRK